MAQITYDDKVYLNENASVPAINKVQDTDMNELKHAINGINDGTDVLDNLVVGSVRTKNMFDKGSLVQQTRQGVYSTTRVSARQNLYIEPGTYTFSTTMPNTYYYSCHVSANKYPNNDTLIFDAGWQENSTQTFTINTGGYFEIIVKKADNTNVLLEDIINYNFQLETGNSATGFTEYQNLNPELDDIYYKGGETINITSPTYVSGYITSSTQDAKFMIPVPKKLDNVTSVTVSFLQCAIRGTSGYINGTSGWQTYSGDSNYTITGSISNSGCIAITLHKSSAFTNITNNTPFAVDVGKITMTLN